MKSRFSVVALVCACALCPLTAQAQQVTFNFTGSVQTWVVPNNVTSIFVDARGAQGGGNGSLAGAQGGKGGRVQTTLAVVPGETLVISVGGRGGDLIGPNTAGPGGFNGGGTGGIDNVDFNAPSGGGGGASDVRQGGTDLINRVVVAGGGGGSECCTDANGGDGGDLTGMAGATSGGGSIPGGGGTQFSGGAGGGGCNGSGTPGTLGQGGVGGNGNRAGGGGGGGYFGGGGGGGCLFGSGGGGGSSFSAGTNTIHTPGFQDGEGQVIITVQDQAAPPQITGLTAMIGDGSIYLQWNSVSAVVDKFMVVIEEATDTSALNIESTIAFTAGVAVTFRPVGTGVCDPPLANKVPSCLITSLQNGTPLANGVCYRLTVESVIGGLEGNPSDSVVACPSKFSNPGLARAEVTPILFLHGFFGDGRVFGTFGSTLDFLQRTLGWKYGGQLYHFGDELHTGTVHVDPDGFCDNEGHFSCRDVGAVLSTGDFFTASFGSNTADYGDRQGLAHQGSEVDDFVNQLTFDGIRQPLILVAHSNGGLAARDFITRFPTGARRISRLITYGTPHRGADVPVSWLADAIFDGARDAQFTCSPDLKFSNFLTDLNTKTLPSSIEYVSLYGASRSNGLPLSILQPFDTLFRDGDRQADCHSPQWDGLVPVSSADLSQVDPLVIGSSTIRVLATKHTHMGQGDDSPSILCALDSNCAMFQVSSPVPIFLVAPVIDRIASTFAGAAGSQDKSPVDIDVIAPDGSRMGTTFAGIAGASYMNIIGDNGQETITALVPFPQGGAYTIKAFPREGSLPTDSFTIMLTQNGITTTIADHMLIQDIPSNGFQQHVNSRPFANAGADQTVECASPKGTAVTLNGSLSGDQDGDVLTYVWSDSQGNIVGNTAVVTVVAAMGTQSYSLTVTDPSGLSAAVTTQVTVRDTTPPVVHLTLTPSSLWPPNHKLVPITANIQVSDVCDPNPTVALVSITSNEPDSGSGDIQGAILASDDRSFLLRAERLGTGVGRTYTVTYRVTDHSGNATLISGQVLVPHDQGTGSF